MERRDSLSLGSTVAVLALALEHHLAAPPSDVVRADFFITLIVFAAIAVGLQLLLPGPDLEDVQPSPLGDFQFPTTTQDRVKPIGWGTFKQKGPNVTWYGDLQQRAITESVKINLFKQKRITTGYKYDVGIMFKPCRGTDYAPVALREINIDGTSAWSGNITGEGTAVITLPELFGGDEFGAGGVEGTVTWRPGTSTQSVPSYLTGLGNVADGGLGVNGVVPRQTQDAYALFERGYIGNSTSIKPWEFVCQRIPNQLGLSVAGVNSDADANPANVVYEILTNREFGRGYPASDINLTNFASIGDTLRAEGNGFSYLWDRVMSIDELLDIVMRQIDGALYQNPSTGKYEIKLARPEVGPFPTVTKPIEVLEYTSTTWRDAVSEVQVSFSNRDNNYDPMPALSHNPASALRQGGGTLASAVAIVHKARYPGVKDAALAGSISWRLMRTLSVPLIQAKLRLEREFETLLPGQLLTWQDETRGFATGLDFRVKTIDYGTPEDNRIVVEIAEDIFQQNPGSYSPPPASLWTPPNTLATNPSAGEAIAMESPRMVFKRGGSASGDPVAGLFGNVSLILASMRQLSGVVAYDIGERHSSGTPSGNFTIGPLNGSVGFMLKGELASALSKGVASPVTIEVVPSADSQSAIVGAIESTTAEDAGTFLVNLIMIGDPNVTDPEFILCLGAANNASNVNLTNCYRGIGYTTQKAWAAATPVFFLCAGANGNAGPAMPPTNNVDVRFFPENAFNRNTTGLLDISYTNTRRGSRPSPPGRISLGATIFASSASLEGNGANAENYGLDVDWLRRSYDTNDEIGALSNDVATEDPNYVSNSSYVTNLTVINISGSPTTLFTTSDIAGTSATPLRIAILQATGGVIPTDLRIQLQGKHDDFLGGSGTLTSEQVLEHDFTVTTALTGQFEFGALDTNDISNVYTATETGSYTVSISSTLSTGEVQYRIDGGTWTTVLSSSESSDTITVNSGEDLEFRHTSTDSSLLVQLDIDAPASGQDGFAILFT